MLIRALSDPTSMKLIYIPAAIKSGTMNFAISPKRWPKSAASGQVCFDKLRLLSGAKTPIQNAIAVRCVVKVIFSNNLSYPATCPILLKDQIAMRPPSAEIPRPGCPNRRPKISIAIPAS